MVNGHDAHSRKAEDSRITQEGQVLRRCLATPSAGRQVRYLIEVFRGEVGCIELILEVGYKGRIDVTDSRPIDSVEEGMALDLVDVQSVLGSSQQPENGS
jgi:hypothetical protein